MWRGNPPERRIGGEAQRQPDREQRSIRRHRAGPCVDHLQQCAAQHRRDTGGEPERHTVHDECPNALPANAGRSHERHRDGDVPPAVADTEQQVAEDEKARKANQVLICDTDLMTTVIYSNYFLKTCPEWIVRESYERKYDLFLLTNIDIPWVGNKWRDAPHLREHFHDWFRRELELRHRPYVVISGSSIEERLDHAIGAIVTLFDSRWAPGPSGIS